MTTTKNTQETSAKRKECETTALADTRTMTPGQMATVLLEQEAFDVEKLARLMELQERHEANEARKAYIQALGIFHSQCPTIIRTKSVGYGKGDKKVAYRHAGLAETMDQIRELLSQCQLSVNWTVTRNEPQWIEVECVVSHVAGHTERTSLGGPPDTSGNKNLLQARASTVSYLERYTLKALLGLVDRDDEKSDDDGQGGAADGKAEEPPSQTALQDADAKKAFAKACLTHWKGKGKPSGPQYMAWLEQAKQLSGKTTIADCAKWLEDHGTIRDGKVASKAATEPQDAEWETPSDSGPPEGLFGDDDAAMKFACEVCGTLYAVKPARGACMAEDNDGFACKGKVVDRTKQTT